MTEDDFDIDFGGTFDVEAGFVGRQKDLQRLHVEWGCKKIFGIFGLRSVGKSRLVKEFLNQRSKNKFTLIRVDLKVTKDAESLYISLCAALGLEPETHAVETDRWIHHVCEIVTRSRGKCFVFFFDNAEDFQELRGPETRDSFLSLCTNLSRQCRNIKLFITSTTRVQFSQLPKAYFSHEVLPLNKTESRNLLKSVAPDVDLGQYEDALVALSEGLPLLILMIGSELLEDGGMITPKDMVEFLLTCRLKSLSREFYPAEDRVADVYRKFIDRLDMVYKRRLTVLEYIPGTFSADQARQILSFKSDAMVKDQALIPIRRRHILNFDPKTGRYSIQGILRDCMRVFYTIRNLPETRARYCEIFSSVMTNISTRLDTAEYTKALAEFTEEQPNLQKLLTEVTYTRQDTYRFFIEMVTKCTALIERYMTGDGEDFYQGCLKAADLYGQDRDKASVNLAVGSMYTNIKGNLNKGAENYESALSVLENNGKSLQLATAYQRLGWNLLQQGRPSDATKFFKKSLDISLVSGPDYQMISLQSMNSMGVSLTHLGQFEDAERYHFASLKRRVKVQGEDHASVGACFNNIGVMYDQKGDKENAFKYYQKGLEVKLKSKAPVLSVVFSLGNVANMRIATGNYEEAHKYLDDAFDILNRETVPPKGALAFAYDTRGKAYLKEGKLVDAEEMFQKAVDVREDIADNMPCLESLVHLAEVNSKNGKFKNSLSVLTKALKLKDKATATMPQSSLIADCYRCLAEVYNRTNDVEKYRDTLEKIETELLRLERVYLCQCNEKGVQRIQEQLADIKHKLDTAD